jgi:hypothetical protein
MSRNMSRKTWILLHPAGLPPGGAGSERLARGRIPCGAFELPKGASQRIGFVEVKTTATTRRTSGCGPMRGILSWSGYRGVSAPLRRGPLTNVLGKRVGLLLRKVSEFNVSASPSAGTSQACTLETPIDSSSLVRQAFRINPFGSMGLCDTEAREINIEQFAFRAGGKDTWLRDLQTENSQTQVSDLNLVLAFVFFPTSPNPSHPSPLLPTPAPNQNHATTWVSVSWVSRTLRTHMVS